MTFTPDQVASLTEHQTAQNFHPYTCPKRHDGNHRFVLYRSRRARAYSARVDLPLLRLHAGLGAWLHSEQKGEHK